jgi:parallel beta-helix repeat protein
VDRGKCGLLWCEMKILRSFLILSLLSSLLIFLIPATHKLSSSAAAAGRAFYIDQDANGDHDGTSWTDAWTSFGQIDWGVFQPGDILYISGGTSSKTYNESLDIGAGGAEGDPIIITRGADAGHDGEVILDGQLTLSYGVRVEGQAFVIVCGLTVGNYIDSGQIRVRYSSEVIVENNKIYVTGHGGVYLHDNDNVIVRNNAITTPSYLAAQTDGIYSQLNVGNVYEGNYILINNDETTGHDDAIQMYRDRDITIRNNYLEQYNSKVSNAQGIYATNSYGTIKAYNNIVYGPNTKNCLLTLAIYDEGDAHLIAYHNTLVGGGWGVVYVKDAPNSIVQNNIMVTFKDNGWLFRLDGTLTDPQSVDYNIYFAPNSGITSSIDDAGVSWEDWQSSGYETHGFNTDPLLMDIVFHDFSLSEGSHAIDNGNTIPSVIADFTGLQRPQGAGYDIGAYEYAGASPTFVDVPFNHPYYDEIEILYQNGYTAGCSTDPLMYCPEQVLNRAESAVFVERGIHGAEVDPPDPTVVVFNDVALDAWYADWVHGLWEDGYTAGCGTDPLRYCPDQEYTRAEGTVFYLRMMYGADYEPPGAKGYFTDVDPGMWYAKWVDAAYEAGIAEPCMMEPELRFCPEDPLTRAVAAYMMVQAKDLSP